MSAEGLFQVDQSSRAALLHAGRPFSWGKLISRYRIACGAHQLIRLFQNVGIFRLFSRKKAEQHERRTKYQAYQHNSPIGASVCTVK